MPIEWWSRDQLPFTLMIILGILGFLLFQGGYYLGWWNDIHDSGAIVTAVTFFLGIAATYLLNASKKQVVGVGADVRGVGNDVRDVGRDVRALGQKMDHQTRILEAIRDRLPPGSAP